MQEMQVPFLGWEDPLEKEVATHSSILVWRIPWTKEPGRLQSMGSKELTEHLSTQEQEYGQSPTRLLCPWDFPGKNNGVGCHFLLQGIFPTQ